jgi:predicted ArsR family transcriptional regulator
MSTPTETSDGQLLDLLRQRGAMSVSEVSAASEVTATAVRQRLNRLMAQGLIAREVAREGRGRPSHRYSLTEKARRQVGTNFADLAIVLWNEIRAIKDPTVQRGLLERLSRAMAEMYADRIAGGSPEARMESLKELFAERRIPVNVSHSDGRPQLAILDCPYTDLAQHDRGVCAMEKMLFSELLQTDVKLSQCRLDGHECCQFQTN